MISVRPVARPTRGRLALRPERFAGIARTIAVAVFSGSTWLTARMGSSSKWRPSIARHHLERGAAQLFRQVAADRLEPADQVLERLAGNPDPDLGVGLDVVAGLVGVQEREQLAIPRSLRA